MNHHNSAVLRLERAPPSMCPSPNRPRYQTCVWMDPLCMNVWTQCWGARFISSNEKKRPQQGTILSPWWAGPGVRLRVSHVRENGRMSCVCLAACVTGSMRDWVRTHAETEEKNNKSNNIWRETKIEKRNNEVSKGFRKEILPLKERLILKSLKGRTLDMEKKIIVITRILFLFWIIVNLVLIDTGQCYWQVWSSSALY